MKMSNKAYTWKSCRGALDEALGVLRGGTIVPSASDVLGEYGNEAEEALEAVERRIKDLQQAISDYYFFSSYLEEYRRQGYEDEYKAFQREVILATMGGN